MVRHLLTIEDLSAKEIWGIFSRAAALKQARRAGKRETSLAGKSLAMIFEKPSTRTRISFEVGMFELGGHALHLASSNTQLGRGETYADTARVLSRYVHGIMIRTFAQDAVASLAEFSTVPVINGLTDRSHPCQVLTDIFTVIESRAGTQDVSRVKMCYVGDGNNMANSWIEAALVLGFPLAIATPPGFEPDAPLSARAQKNANGASIEIHHDPVAAVRGAAVINTDTWVSMGQEGDDLAQKKQLFAPFQVNAQLLRHAAPDAIVLHCLPAHRGEEITDEIMDGPQSRVFDEAENRLHVQKALLEWCMK